MKLTAQQVEAMGGKRVGPPPTPRPFRRRGPQAIRPRKFVEARTVITDKTSAEIVLPIQIISLANQRAHWSVKSERAAEQSGACELAVKSAAAFLSWWPERQTLGVIVTLTRLGVRKMDSHDGLRDAFKAVVDGIANGLQIGTPKMGAKKVLGLVVTTYRYDDSDARISWEYAQEYPSAYGVRVRVEPRGDRC